MARTHLSAAQARRIALAAQGFDRPRPKGRVDARHLRRLVHQLGIVQIDFVNVLVPAHFMVPFSRLGPYSRPRFHDVLYGSDEFTEQWAHEASILPASTWPLLRFRMARHRVRPRGFEKFLASYSDYADWVLKEVRRRGPLAAEDLPEPEGVERKIEHAWNRTVPRAVLDAHFGRGSLAVADRRPNFMRSYDLAERRIPREHLRRKVTTEQSHRELLMLAARSHGVGTVEDLADYYRLSMAEARPRIAELIEAGELLEVRVEGWKKPALLHPEAKKPRCIRASTLLSPFDPLVWFRPRDERLFGFEYRIEIYVPAPKRRWGYYVLPFLLGDRIVARVDLKAERKSKQLQVSAAHLEDSATEEIVSEALMKELRTLARWLKLEQVTVGKKGNLTRALRAHLRVS
jgi:uncharacterized protein YcaQ